MFIEEILKYNSIAIVGLAKNAGKTECLNYILRKVKNTGKAFRPYLNRHRRGKQGSGLPNAQAGN